MSHPPVGGAQHKVPMTIAGAEKLRAELERLKKTERPHIIQAIAEARAHGDLKENAEYHAARERQGFIEGRIRKIESTLSHAQIIDITSIREKETVLFGATVTLFNLETEQKTSYQIVGEEESDIKQHKISITSPIARALIGKRLGDEVQVTTPSGIIEYEIEEIKYV